MQGFARTRFKNSPLINLRSISACNEDPAKSGKPTLSWKIVNQKSAQIWKCNKYEQCKAIQEQEECKK